jgi:tRNA threonylcarbamoyl adenosine modification protein (Sua5/YciO/YrdC/YwlC family)
VNTDVEALLAGELAILPTDTVYGIGAAASVRAACDRLYRLKSRPGAQPVAVAAGSVELLLSAVVPDAGESAHAVLRALLPGPLTLIVPHPGGRFAHLCGGRPALGVRVPVLEPRVAALSDGAGGLALTSANLRGEPAPAALDEVPGELLAACRVTVDGGRLPGSASAVIDITGPAPVVVRDGPGADDALRRIAQLGY